MIDQTIEKEISNRVGSQPQRYLCAGEGSGIDSGCLYWELPARKPEDKPISVRYREICAEILHLSSQDQDHPQIKSLTEEANLLLAGIPVTKQFGFYFVEEHDFIEKDNTLGIRKEWWELRTRFANENVTIFIKASTLANAPGTEADLLIAMSSRDQYDFLRYNETQGNNHQVSTEKIITELKKLDEEYGIQIVFASRDLVEFLFTQTVKDGKLKLVRNRLMHLCPSIENDSGRTHLRRVTLWWD